VQNINVIGSVGKQPEDDRETPIAAFSSGFGWAKFKGILPFDMSLASLDGNFSQPLNQSLSTRRQKKGGGSSSSSGTSTANKNTNIDTPDGESGVSDGGPVCRYAMADTLLDRIVTCTGTLVVVFMLREALKLVLTYIVRMKEVPDDFSYPMWEAPTLMSQYFAITDALTFSLSSDCEWWVYVGIILLVFGPILALFILWLRVQRHIRDEKLSFDAQEPIPFSEMRENFGLAKGAHIKVRVIAGWILNRRYLGDWDTGNVVGRKYCVLIGDFTMKTWRYFAWLMLEKVIVLSVTAGLTGTVNASLVVAVYSIRLLLLCWMLPFNDHKINATEIMGAFTTVSSTIMAALPAFLGNIDLMPEFYRGGLLLVMTTMGTTIAAVSAILSPIIDSGRAVVTYGTMLVNKVQEMVGGAGLTVPEGAAGAIAGAMAVGVAMDTAEGAALEKAAGQHMTREGSQRFAADHKGSKVNGKEEAGNGLEGINEEEGSDNEKARGMADSHEGPDSMYQQLSPDLNDLMVRCPSQGVLDPSVVTYSRPMAARLAMHNSTVMKQGLLEPTDSNQVYDWRAVLQSQDSERSIHFSPSAVGPVLVEMPTGRSVPPRLLTVRASSSARELSASQEDSDGAVAPPRLLTVRASSSARELSAFQDGAEAHLQGSPHDGGEADGMTASRERWKKWLEWLRAHDLPPPRTSLSPPPRAPLSAPAGASPSPLNDKRPPKRGITPKRTHPPKLLINSRSSRSADSAGGGWPELPLLREMHSFMSEGSLILPSLLDEVEELGCTPRPSRPGAPRSDGQPTAETPTSAKVGFQRSKSDTFWSPRDVELWFRSGDEADWSDLPEFERPSSIVCSTAAPKPQPKTTASDDVWSPKTTMDGALFGEWDLKAPDGAASAQLVLPGDQ